MFEGIESDLSKLRDRWLHYLGSLCLGHDSLGIEDFGNFIHILIEL